MSASISLEDEELLEVLHSYGSPPDAEESRPPKSAPTSEQEHGTKFSASHRQVVEHAERTQTRTRSLSSAALDEVMERSRSVPGLHNILQSNQASMMEELTRTFHNPLHRGGGRSKRRSPKTPTGDGSLRRRSRDEDAEEEDDEDFDFDNLSLGSGSSIEELLRLPTSGSPTPNSASPKIQRSRRTSRRASASTSDSSPHYYQHHHQDPDVSLRSADLSPALHDMMRQVDALLAKEERTHHHTHSSAFSP